MIESNTVFTSGPWYMVLKKKLRKAQNGKILNWHFDSSLVQKQMRFAFLFKNDPAVHEWRNCKQSNSQIFPVKIWKPYPEKRFQSFVDRATDTLIKTFFIKTDACK